MTIHIDTLAAARIQKAAQAKVAGEAAWMRRTETADEAARAQRLAEVLTAERKREVRYEQYNLDETEHNLLVATLQEAVASATKAWDRTPGISECGTLTTERTAASRKLNALRDLLEKFDATEEIALLLPEGDEGLWNDVYAAQEGYHG